MNPSIPMVDPAGEYRALKVEIDAAVGRVLASGPLRARPGGRGARARARRLSRRQPRRGRELRHRRAAPAARSGRHRSGRRGGHSGLHLFRHRRSGVLHRRDAGVRRRGRGHVQSRSCFAYQEDHEENEGRHRGPSFRAVRCARPDFTNLPGEETRPGRRLRAVHRRRLRRQASRQLGRLRRVLVLSHQEPRRRRRRRHDHREERGSGEDPAHAAPSRQPADLPARARGLEQPPGRAAGGGPAGQAQAPRALQRRAARGGAALSREARRREDRPAGRAWARHARLPPVHHPRQAPRRHPRSTREGGHRELGVLSLAAAPAARVRGYCQGCFFARGGGGRKSVLSLPIHPLLDEASIDRIAACVRAAA